jgi:predicted house-cleaning noncanonical NTP pyrophosphatase (MazG superfamily)
MAKLVRDLIPEIIKQNGSSPIIRRITGTDLLNALEDKLAEEHAEYVESRNIEELADMVEAILALAKVKGHSRDDLFSIVENKRVERGGFDEGFFWEGNEEPQS